MKEIDIEKLAEEKYPRFDNPKSKDRIEQEGYEDKREGFIAGYKAAQGTFSQGQGKGMRWVECSERLPETKQVVIVKVIDKNGIAVHGDGYVLEVDGKKQWFLGDHRHDFPVKLTNNVFEWLDESAAQGQGKDGEITVKDFENAMYQSPDTDDMKAAAKACYALALKMKGAGGFTVDWKALEKEFDNLSLADFVTENDKSLGGIVGISPKLFFNWFKSKLQSTSGFTEQQMIDFAEFCENWYADNAQEIQDGDVEYKTIKELLVLFQMPVKALDESKQENKS